MAESYGGSTLHWKLDILWCLLRYGARRIVYVRFEFHRESALERDRYQTIYRYFRIQKYFGTGKEGIMGKIEEYTIFTQFIRHKVDQHIMGLRLTVCKCVNNRNGLVVSVPVNESDVY